MTFELYLAFVAATTIMILLPGPSVLLTVAHAMAFGGRRAGRWFRGRRGHLVRNRVTGTLMIGAGLGLALARRG